MPRAHSSQRPAGRGRLAGPRQETRGRGGAGRRRSAASGTPEQQAKQTELEKNTPQLKVTEEVLQLSVPGQTIGEAVGVAKNSQGHLFVFSRTGHTATVKGSAASKLFEFDQNLKFVKQWGPNNYAAGFAHTVRVDKDDNVWMTDEGANMIVKFRPGRQRRDDARPQGRAARLARALRRGRRARSRPTTGAAPVGRSTGRPTSPGTRTATSSSSDGYNNSRVAKFDKNGNWVKALGTRGSAPNQFNTPHGITSDNNGNIYVADRGNRRVQVYNSDLKRLRIIEGMGAPWSACISPGATQHLFSGDGNGKIYKFDLDGKLRRLGADQPWTRPERLPGARTALRVGHRPLQGRLLDVAGRENHAPVRNVNLAI